MAGGVGRPRRYCRRSCRQRAYEERHVVRDRAWLEGRITELARRVADLEDARASARDELDLVLDELTDGPGDHRAPSVAELTERLCVVRADLEA